MSKIERNRELHKLFQTKLKPRLGYLDIERKEVLERLILFMPLAIGSVGFITFYFRLPPAVIFFCVIGIASLVHWLVTSEYVKKFKKVIMHDIFKTVIPGSVYNPQQFVPSGSFDKSEIFGSYTDYSGDDLVFGKLGKFNLTFSELKVKREEGSGKHKRTITVFNGLFFDFELPSNLKQKTLILHDKAEGFFGAYFGRMIQKHLRRGYELVQVESVDFEKKYVVYSNDQIESRRLLTPTVIENLSEYRQKYKEKLSISLQENHIYVAIDSTRHFFEPKIWGEVFNFNDVQEISDIIGLVTDVLTELEIDKKVA